MANVTTGRSAHLGSDVRNQVLGQENSPGTWPGPHGSQAGGV
jgi:hypothetical protein